MDDEDPSSKQVFNVDAEALYSGAGLSANANVNSVIRKAICFMLVICKK